MTKKILKKRSPIKTSQIIARSKKSKVINKKVSIDSGLAAIVLYEKALSKKYFTIAKKLRIEINNAIQAATSKVWHGHPVWFVKETPVVGYSLTAKKGISLLFWNGQAFKEPTLLPVGKFKAAQFLFQDLNEIDLPLLRKLLKKSAKEIWDYKKDL